MTVGDLNMEKAARIFIAALAFWLLAAPCANSAGLSEGRANGRDYNAASVRKTKLSAMQRSARAAALLGFKYEHGLGVPQSFDVAVDLYVRAAEQGDPTGQFLLGLMYDKGHGIWQDEVLAHKWLNLAAAHAPARNREHYLKLRDAVASKMTPSQIYAAQMLAVQWAPKPPQW
jgi:TPR repeat protein